MEFLLSTYDRYIWTMCWKRGLNRVQEQFINYSQPDNGCAPTLCHCESTSGKVPSKGMSQCIISVSLLGFPQEPFISGCMPPPTDCNYFWHRSHCNILQVALDIWQRTQEICMGMRDVSQEKSKVKMAFMSRILNVEITGKTTDLSPGNWNQETRS